MGTFMTGDFHQADVLLSVKLGGWGSGQCSYRLRSKKQCCSLIPDDEPGIGERIDLTPAIKEEVTTLHSCGQHHSGPSTFLNVSQHSDQRPHVGLVRGVLEGSCQRLNSDT